MVYPVAEQSISYLKQNIAYNTMLYKNECKNVPRDIEKCNNVLKEELNNIENPKSHPEKLAKKNYRDIFLMIMALLLIKLLQIFLVIQK